MYLFTRPDRTTSASYPRAEAALMAAVAEIRGPQPWGAACRFWDDMKHRGWGLRSEVVSPGAVLAASGAPGTCASLNSDVSHAQVARAKANVFEKGQVGPDAAPQRRRTP